MISAPVFTALILTLLCSEAAFAIPYKTIAPPTVPHKPSPPPHHPELINCHAAFRNCAFTFKGTSGIPIFDINVVENKAFTPSIMSKRAGEKLGILNTNHIPAEFIIGGRALPVTMFGSQRFTPTAFKPFAIPYTSGSGVGRETFHGDQLSIADGKCVRLFFTNYQTLFPGHTVKANIYDVSRKSNNCVVFKVEVGSKRVPHVSPPAVHKPTPVAEKVTPSPKVSHAPTPSPKVPHTVAPTTTTTTMTKAPLAPKVPHTIPPMKPRPSPKAPHTMAPTTTTETAPKDPHTKAPVHPGPVFQPMTPSPEVYGMPTPSMEVSEMPARY